MFKNKIFNKADKAAKQQPVFKQDYFNNCHRTYSCIHCRAHLANHDELISKLFQGNHGRAYLFNKVVNIGCKQAVQRELLTGLHAVADIYCDSCETTLGWKYEQAFVPSQKYKEGKYIIELVHMLKENNWDLTSYNARELLEETKTYPTVVQYKDLRIGNLNGIGIGNYDETRDYYTNRRHQSRHFVVSIDLERRNETLDRQVAVCINNENLSKAKQQIPPPLLTNNNDHISENIASRVLVGMQSDGIELLERSLDKLQLNKEENVYTKSIINNNNNNNDDSTITSRISILSPDNSLCSSQSHSDISSASSTSATYSGSSSADKSSSASNQVTSSEHMNASDNPIRDQIISGEKLTIIKKNEDSTTTTTTTTTNSTGFSTSTV